jgi:Arc/MetJ-type ribon-helix-helix transcriptional regulator
MRLPLDPQSKTIRVSFAISQDLWERFQAQADSMERDSASEILRDLIDHWLRQTAKIRRLRERAR